LNRKNTARKNNVIIECYKKQGEQRSLTRFRLN
jgi:hypothetical protein